MIGWLADVPLTRRPPRNDPHARSSPGQWHGRRRARACVHAVPGLAGRIVLVADFARYHDRQARPAPTPRGVPSVARATRERPPGRRGNPAAFLFVWPRFDETTHRPTHTT